MGLRLKDNPLFLRVVSALVLAPVCLYTLYKGPPYSLVLGGIIALGLIVEWIGLLWKCRLSWAPKILFGLVGTAYLGVAIAWVLYALTMKPWQDYYCWIVILLLLIVWATDIGAFLGGRFFQGPKLAPSISPNKTWSGFVTGMVTGVGVGWFLLWYCHLYYGFGVPLPLLVLTAQIGDLLESKAKRWCRVKDSSNLIPGHGGLLDRLDSFLAVSFILGINTLVYLYTH